MVSLVASTARRAMRGLLPLLLLAVGASGCLGKERDALLAFKAGLKDPGGQLASWSGSSNCCRWNGVTCSNNTGRVVKLDLHNDLDSALSGAIDPSLVSLAHLEYIDLKGNDFRGASIPGFIGSLNNLKHLDLSSTRFGGEIPPQLGNLSRLSYLNISYTDASVSSGGLHWLCRLSSLTHLDLSGCNLSAASGWLESVSMLSSLQVLLLEDASLPPTDLNSPSHANFTDLNKIDMSGNNFSSTFPYWLTNLRTVSSVALTSCGLHGRIPESLWNLSSLNHLDLSNNNLVGEISRSIGALCNLKVLLLSENNLTGDVASIGKANSSGKLSHLSDLSLSDNSLHGTLTEQHLANLPNLSFLALSGKSLRIAVDINWVPPFQLIGLDLRSCQLESQFLHWLRTQTGIAMIGLRDTGCGYHEDMFVIFG